MKNRTIKKYSSVMSFVTLVLTLIFLSFSAGCKANVNSDEDSNQKVDSLQFQGDRTWASSYLSFQTDRCAFLVQSSFAEDQFVLKRLLVDCDRKGTVGLFTEQNFILIDKAAANLGDVSAAKAPACSLFAIR